MRLTHKAILLVALFSALSFAAYAEARSAVGHGDTEAEAIDDARFNLISSFSVKVSSLTITSDTDDGAGSTSSSMSSYSAHSVQFDLVGQEESARELDDGTWEATATLPESAARFYTVKLDDLYPTINTLNNLVENASDKSSVKSQYLQLIQALREYEQYRTVVMILSPSTSVRPLPTSSGAVEAQYQSILMEENNEMEITLMDLEQQRQLGILSSRDESAYQEALAKLEANRKEQEELRKRRDEEYQTRALELEQQFSASISLAQADPSLMSEIAEEGLSISATMNRIEANRGTFSAIKETLRDELYDNQIEYEAAYDSYYETEMDKPYSSTEMVGGLPTQVAIDNRERLIEATFAEGDGAYYASVADLIYSEAFGRMSQLTNMTLDYIDALNANRFTLSSGSDEVSAVVEGFNRGNNSWYGTANVTIGSTTVELYFLIPYTAWTGKSVPNARNATEYAAYLEECDEWLQLFIDYPSSYGISFDFDIIAQTESSNYTVSFRTYRIIRTDTGEVVSTRSIQQNDRISFSPSVNIMDFSVSTMGLVEDWKYKFERVEGLAAEEPIVISNQTSQASDLVESQKEQLPESHKISEEERNRKAKPTASYVTPIGGEIGVFSLFPLVGEDNPDMLLGVEIAGHAYSFPGMSSWLGLEVWGAVGLRDGFTFPTDTFVEESRIGVGATFTTFYPLTNVFQLMVGAAGGAEFNFCTPHVTDSGEASDFGVGWYAGVDAGVVFNFGGFGLELAGKAGYYFETFAAGAEVSFIIALG